MFLVLTLFGGGRSVPFLAIAMAILGFTGALGNIALEAYIVQNVAETMLARVLSVGRLTSFTALALGPLLGGYLVKEVGAQAGIAVLLIAAAMLRLPPRRADRRGVRRTRSRLVRA